MYFKDPRKRTLAFVASYYCKSCQATTKHRVIGPRTARKRICLTCGNVLE